MAITEAQFHESLMAQKETKRKEWETSVRLLRQAAVDAQYLTGREEWDKYLRMLQAELDGANKELASMYAALGTPLTDEQLRLTYVSINVFNERVRVLTQCMTLPKQICEDAAKVPA